MAYPLSRLRRLSSQWPGQARFMAFAEVACVAAPDPVGFQRRGLPGARWGH